MSGKAAKVIVSEKQYRILQEIVAAPSSSKQLSQRAEIILLAFDKKLNSQIARQVNLNRIQVGI